MQPAFRKLYRSDVWIDRISREIHKELEGLQIATVEAKRLRAIEYEPKTGSKPLYVVADALDHRFVLKVAERPLMAAEVAAHALRRLGQRPSVAARIVQVDIAEIGCVEGLLKPFIEFDAHRMLSSDSEQWTELQRMVILVEHAWEWFLDNLDTNPSQYALLPPRDYPLNIDWDRAFATEGLSKLSRFAKYRRALPNARTFLYADYVEGRVPLDFAPLLREARHIRRMPKADVRRILEEYAVERYEGPEQRTEFVSRMMARQQDMERAFVDFVLDLRSERREFSGHPSGMKSRLKAGAVTAWKRWQLILNAVVRGRVGHVGRGLLKAIRARSLGSPAAFRPRLESRGRIFPPRRPASAARH